MNGPEAKVNGPQRRHWTEEEAREALALHESGGMVAVHERFVPQYGKTWLRKRLWELGVEFCIYRRVTDEEVSIAKEMIHKGSTLIDVAKKFQMNVANLSQQLQRRGVRRFTCVPWRLDEVRDFKQAHAEGLSIKDLQKRFCRTRGSVISMIRRSKLKRRRAVWTPAMRAVVNGRVENLLVQLAQQFGIPETKVASRVVVATINRQKRLKFSNAIAKAAA